MLKISWNSWSFFAWDNTPRHKERGYIISHVSNKLFNEYLDSIKQDEYMFVNAWNEWAEGMIMEPTELDGYQNLNWLLSWKKNNS